MLSHISYFNEIATSILSLYIKHRARIQAWLDKFVLMLHPLGPGYIELSENRDRY